MRNKLLLITNNQENQNNVNLMKNICKKFTLVFFFYPLAIFIKVVLGILMT